MINFIKTSKARKRSGVILVFVLTLLTLSAALSSQIASSVLRLIGQAESAQKEAQERWAIVSIRRACLQVAPKLISPSVEDQENRQDLTRSGAVDQDQVTEVATSRRMFFQLGSVQYDVLIEDESAKVPLQRVIREATLEQSKILIRKLSGGRMLLQPVNAKSPMNWNDVFQPNSRAGDTADNLREATKNVTIWTDGKLNAKTCSKQALEALWQWKFSTTPPDYLLDAIRKQKDESNIDEVFGKLGMNQRQRDFSKNWLSLTSNTYSMSITNIRKDNSNKQHYLFVKRKENGFADAHFGFHDP